MTVYKYVMTNYSTLSGPHGGGGPDKSPVGSQVWATCVPD